MQSVKFRNLTDFLEFLPPDELRMTEYFRKIIMENVPDAEEKLSFNVPYYQRNKGLFFLWPGSVLWGSKRTYHGVRFGFQQGYLLEDDEGFLEKGTRKQIFWKTFSKMAQINERVLLSFIIQAIKIDAEFKKK